MEQNKKEGFYDDGFQGILRKDLKKKLEKKSGVDIDTESISQKATEVLKKLDSTTNNIVKEKTNNNKGKMVKTPRTNESVKTGEGTSNITNKQNTNNSVRNNVQKQRKFNNTKTRKDTNDNNIVTSSKANSNDKRTNSIFEKGKLKIIPLGGLQEIGKNLTIFEYEKEIVIVDCGIAFPEDDMLGVDLVIPDITYLEKNVDKIKGIVVTHGHEDHIGAIPYFLQKINVPIYATKLTMGLIENKLEEHNLLRDAKLHIIKPKDRIKFGSIEVEAIKTTHSIADSLAFALHTPVGTIVHTGDFKIDYTPIDGEVTDFARFAELGREGVLLLMSDSTNVERPGYTMSERSVGLEFDKIFMNSNKRILVATFASNIHRMQQIINSAVKFGRKVAPIGRSVLKVIDVAKELGYITAPEDSLIDIDKINLYNPEQLVIITTGSQGESMSALSRMSTGDHRKVTITPEDLVIFSSSPIPGNEKSVGRVIDELQKLGAEVIYNQLADVHVSGHACQEELKMMITLTKPKFFMPVHGEYRFLIHHGEIAKLLGVNSDNIFIMANGKTLEVTSDSARIGAQVQSGIVLVDGLGVGDVGNIVIRDRQMLSENGMILIVFSLESKTAKLLGGPDIITRGFVYVRESEDLVEEIKDFSKKQILKLQNEGVTEWSTIKNTVRDSLCDFVYKKTKRNPMILPIITEVNTQNIYKM